jgi:hypothetical protein
MSSDQMLVDTVSWVPKSEAKAQMSSSIGAFTKHGQSLYCGKRLLTFWYGKYFYVNENVFRTNASRHFKLGA